MATVAALTAVTLSGCTNDDATGAEGTPSAAQTTTDAEPSAVETTEAPTPTESEPSEWTAEEAALIEEAEAFYLQSNDLYISVAQAGFTDPDPTNELLAQYSGAAREELHAEMLESASYDITLDGEPTTVSVSAVSVTDGQDPEVVLDFCVDTSEIEFLVSGESQPDAPPGSLRVLRDRLVLSQGTWTIAEHVDYRIGSCDW